MWQVPVYVIGRCDLWHVTCVRANLAAAGCGKMWSQWLTTCHAWTSRSLVVCSRVKCEVPWSVLYTALKCSVLWSEVSSAVQCSVQYSLGQCSLSTVHYPIFRSDVLDFNSSSTSHFTKCIFWDGFSFSQRRHPEVFINQYKPLGVYCAIHTPEHLLREWTEHLVLGQSAICRQAQTRASVRMHSVRAHVMPYHTVILQN